MPPPADPRAMSEYPDPLTFSLLDRLGRRTDGNGYPRPNLNNNRSLISRLTNEPGDSEIGLPTAPRSSSNPDDALVYPDPTPNPDIKYKVEHLKPQFHPRVEHIPTVGGEVALAESEDVVEDEDRENQTPENVEDPPIVSLRSPTPAPTPMMQLVDHVSALCADWSAISPDIARSTCVADASRLSLDIHLDTALTNEGLAALRVEGLIRAQTLCRMVTVMTMSETITTNPTTISEGNVEMLVKEYDQDAQLLFVGADPRKVRLLSVEERQAMGWQPVPDTPATPMMEVEDEMPEDDDRLDTSYDYDTELYGDGES
uniref:Reverse transcriptase-rnase h-integrase n=1 Tax=Moniliophthora roreri TaxID=221103 RepID=A0A0W0F780_MONRR